MPLETKTGYASIDKPWLKYYEQPAELITGKSVYEVLFEHNHNNLAQVALEYFGQKISYQKLFERIEEAKSAFERAGVHTGDHVAFFASSTPEIIYSILALCRIGAVANMINPLFEPDQIKMRIEETSPRLIVVLDQLYSKFSMALGQSTAMAETPIIIVPVANSMPWPTKCFAWFKAKGQTIRDGKTCFWNTFIANKGSAQTACDAQYEEQRAYIMVYSSGSTGASKGIVLTNEGICATISHYISPNFPYEQGNRFLQMIPIWFSTGIVLSVLMPLCLGVAVILEPVFSERSFAKDLARYQPNMTLAATSLWLYAINSKELRHKDLSFLRYPITGGELILRRVETAINHFLSTHGCNAPLIKGYGMCELGSTISTDDLRHQKPDAAGFPISGVTVAAFDLDTNIEQPYHQPGELRVLSPAHMKEYFKNPDATTKFFWTDTAGRTWGKTGDIGYIDEDGFVHVLGRTSDYFVGASGKRWYCFDIENIILKNPNIAQCEVIGLPQDGREVPVVHLVPEKESAIDIPKLLLSLHAACVDALDAECVPQGYRVCKAFPIKNNGKRDMDALKKVTHGFLFPPV